MHHRPYAVLWLALLGCVAATCAAVGGAGTLIGGVLSAVVLVLFCLLYETGQLGPQLPPWRVRHRTLLWSVWGLVAFFAVLLLMSLLRLLSLHSHP